MFWCRGRTMGRAQIPATSAEAMVSRTPQAACPPWRSVRPSCRAAPTAAPASFLWATAVELDPLLSAVHLPSETGCCSPPPPPPPSSKFSLKHPDSHDNDVSAVLPLSWLSRTHLLGCLLHVFTSAGDVTLQGCLTAKSCPVNNVHLLRQLLTFLLSVCPCQQISWLHWTFTWTRTIEDSEHRSLAAQISACICISARPTP